MPVSAVVITLATDPEANSRARAALHDDPRIEIGPPQKTHLPAVLTTDTIGEGIGMVREELPAMEGVEFVRVVRVDFDDAQPADATHEGTQEGPQEGKQQARAPGSDRAPVSNRDQ